MSMQPDQLRSIAEAIAREILAGGAAPRAVESSPGDGLFATIDECAKAARAAFFALDALGLEKRKRIIDNIRARLRPMAEHLARMAVEESNLGRVDDKIEKIRSYKVRRAKLFYIRGLRGKAARLKEVDRVTTKA